MNLGQYLRNVRKAQKKSLETVSRDIEISMGYLHKIETGKQRRPKMWALEKLARYYGINEDEVISLAGKIPSDVYWLVQQNRDTWRELRERKDTSKVVGGEYV